jgi:hypothetical protein
MRQCRGSDEQRETTRFGCQILTTDIRYSVKRFYRLAPITLIAKTLTIDSESLNADIGNSSY